ncbi:hypothetical protein BU24DRAFT_462202 [Aaosphaeria arxii CBS 175.79]|uniref:Uncharacterized protein n=1 Tax=Aaosphaeria arxii CBS 175.79 TaxID=1450172 RepID=A0A6A5XS47_9PLEO|nr:uncharacterized protein BU24DRAFT_462202 [Aaosphaeria arxii CBS 175.79]KAF2015992.1 hypothetical protein BU24DRAFT_462202 [Aaosphaeria arxii CBS 175.79]
MVMSDRTAGDAQRIASYGRGGAGNIGRDDPTTHTQPADLVTPTLKAEHYTTGRGGTGNIARNDPHRPEIARASQDVDAPIHRDPEGPHHYGRGGAANIAAPSAEEARANRERNRRKSDEARRGSNAAEDVKGLAAKGKDFIKNLGGGHQNNGQSQKK